MLDVAAVFAEPVGWGWQEEKTVVAFG